MTSNDDLMGFLLKMEDKRASDREADRQELREIRVKEREEDKQEMIKVIDKCLGEKVSEAIAPFKDKTDEVVKVQSQMKEQVEMLMDEMKTLKGKLSSHARNEAGPSNSELTMAEVVSAGVGQQNQTVSHQEATGSRFGSQEDELGPVISLGRRTVGLHKIDQADLVRMRQQQYGGAKSEEEEKVLATKEYLQLEMKLSKETIDRMEIERIFSPAKENPQYLYVTFKHVASVAKIFERTRTMRKESRIITYIPKEFHNRFCAIKELEKNLREEEKCKTRIKMGLRDLVLLKKDRAIGTWEFVPIPFNFPPVEFGSQASKTVSGSPVPGRPEQGRGDKRGRVSTGSSNGNYTATVPRVSESEDDSGEQNNDEKDDQKKVDMERDN